MSDGEKSSCCCSSGGSDDCMCCWQVGVGGAGSVGAAHELYSYCAGALRRLSSRHPTRLTCARMADRHTCRSSVLLPPMLGPVSTRKRAPLAAPSSPPVISAGGAPSVMLLGTKQPLAPVRPAGWRS
jgi:hypothetical protein